jgi:hypothetical protein
MKCCNYNQPDKQGINEHVMYNHRMENWQIQLKAEFDKATEARIKKNEGQSRVCARRAAGIAIREYFTRRGTQPPNTSAMDLMNMLQEEANLPADISTIIDHLTVRVTEEFNLPVQADLVAEARVLCRWLLPDWR